VLGEQIREIRKKHHQTVFSYLIGVSQGTLSELEKNKYNPSLETILKLTPTKIKKGFSARPSSIMQVK